MPSLTDIGRRVRLISTTDEYTKLTMGSEGTVFLIDDIGTMFVNWDDGSTLGLLEDEDKWEFVN